jgi:hypothetical protein
MTSSPSLATTSTGSRHCSGRHHGARSSRAAAAISVCPTKNSLAPLFRIRRPLRKSQAAASCEMSRCASRTYNLTRKRARAVDVGGVVVGAACSPSTRSISASCAMVLSAPTDPDRLGRWRCPAARWRWRSAAPAPPATPRCAVSAGLLSRNTEKRRTFQTASTQLLGCADDGGCGR